MPSKRARLTKSIFLALVWMLGQIPSDLLLLHRVPDSAVLQTFSLMLQGMETAAIAYLVYRVISLHRVTVQLCPMCHGYKKLHYIPHSPELMKTADTCPVCGGAGTVYAPVFAEVDA